jgi:hypothetical protein
VLGEAGAGKTSLAMLLVREWARRHAGGDRVPVLIPLSGWDQAAELLPEWLSGRLAENFPALRAAEFGPDAAMSLLRARRILPMLDGFDELPAEAQTTAMRLLSTATAWITTCRTSTLGALAGVLTAGLFLLGSVVIDGIFPDRLASLSPAAALATGLGLGSSLAFKRWAGVATRLDIARTPAAVLRADRTLTLSPAACSLSRPLFPRCTRSPPISMPSRTAATDLPAGQTLREAFAGASLGWRRQAISLVVEKVVIKPRGSGRMMWRGWQFNPDDVEIVWKV